MPESMFPLYNYLLLFNWQEDETNVIPEDMPHIDMKNRDFDLAGFAIKYHNQNPN